MVRTLEAAAEHELDVTQQMQDVINEMVAAIQSINPSEQQMAQAITGV
jgi:hypothetical protein